MRSGFQGLDEGRGRSLVGLTPDGIIESWNTGAERLLGYAHDEAIGQHFSMFYTVEDQRAGLPEMHLREARLEEAADHVGWRIRKDGSQFWGWVQFTALQAEPGRLLGYAKVTRDLAEGMRRDAARATFYDTFMHDFRVPLAAIRGFLDFASDAEPTQRDHFLDRVNANADRLLVMAESLVEHARDLGARPADRLEALDLAALASQVVMTLVADTDRITVTHEPVMVLADPVALHRVIANVLTNALKYSDPGSVISLAAEDTGTTGVLRVTDRGRGIDPDDLDTVFLESERGRLARSDGGTGLGLTSARQLVEELGGTMRIDSEVGAGTTVIISLRKPDGPVGSPSGRPRSHR
ncbi:MAG: PAS domain-containing sensor histidine kinase [Nocardioides sp.]|nr:PAS domain-containing sensor histidine kinase [Nocardioides sp.]